MYGEREDGVTKWIALLSQDLLDIPIGRSDHQEQHSDKSLPKIHLRNWGMEYKYYYSQCTHGHRSTITALLLDGRGGSVYGCWKGPYFDGAVVACAGQHVGHEGVRVATELIMIAAAFTCFAFVREFLELRLLCWAVERLGRPADAVDVRCTVRLLHFGEQVEFRH